jgi:hypothetical protein
MSLELCESRTTVYRGEFKESVRIFGHDARQAFTALPPIAARLFITEGHHGVDSRGSSCGNPAGQCTGCH